MSMKHKLAFRINIYNVLNIQHGESQIKKMTQTINMTFVTQFILLPSQREEKKKEKIGVCLTRLNL